MLSVVEWPDAVDAVWLCEFTHLMQVSVEQTVPRQELSELEVHRTPFSEQPVIHEWGQPGFPFFSCFLSHHFCQACMVLALAVR